MSNGGEETGDIVVDRSCIGCDNCGVGSPQKCCARCGSYYYCSKECQVQHWKQHKPNCTWLKEQYVKWKEAMNNVLPDGTVNDTKEGPCAICLEETITNPVVMPCGHAFCFSCVGQYQQSSKSEEMFCPYCRGEIPDVVDKSLDRAGLYGDRANRASKGPEDQKKYAKLALAEMDALLELSPDKETELYMSISFTKARMLTMTDQPEEAIAAMKEVWSLNEKHPGILDPAEVDYTMIAQAEAYVALGKWKEAEKIYKTLYNATLQSGRHNALVLMGLARTNYELGKYDKAVQIGNVTMKEFRQCPGVHKYVALSQKAKGDIDEAKNIMSRAILYEFHWDEDNLQQNKQILRELSNL